MIGEGCPKLEITEAYQQTAYRKF